MGPFRNSSKRLDRLVGETPTFLVDNNFTWIIGSTKYLRSTREKIIGDSSNCKNHQKITSKTLSVYWVPICLRGEGQDS